MTKKTLLKSSLFPVSVLLSVLAIILACIDVDIAPYPDSFFAPEISHNDRDVHFFVTDNILYGTTDFKTDYTYAFDTTNVKEWEGYFKDKVSGTDISYILYKSGVQGIDTLLYYMKDPGTKISSKLKSNSVLKYVDARATKDFLYYMGYAKRCEQYSTYNPNDWWYDQKNKVNNPRFDKAGMLKLVQGGIKQIGNANSNFVKQRYAFQVIRLYFQMNLFDSCINFYNTNVTLLNSVENTIRYRAMGYLAGAYSKTGQIAEANSTYAIVFDRCNTLRDAAYFSFKPVEEADFSNSLALCASTRQKEILWQMLGIYGDPLRAMKEIYKLNPKSDALDLLLMRAVNKEEIKFLNQSMASMEIDDPDMSKINKDSIHKDLALFIKQVAGAGNTAKPYEWNLAAGYLDWVMGGTDFSNYFTKASAEATSDKLVNEELRLFHLLDKLKNGKAGDKDFETSILPDLKWLKDTSHANGFRKDFAWAFVSDQLSKKYNTIGNMPIRNCFTLNIIQHLTEDYGQRSSSISDSVINVMENFIDKKDKTPFEEFAEAQLPIYKTDFIDLEAIHLMYKYDFKGALAQLNSNNAPGPESVYGDPFIIHINDNHDSDAVLPNKSVKTKKEFLEKMVELQKKADNNTKNANDYFLLANGYYNMSYYGNNRVFFSSKLSSMETYSGYSPDYKDWPKEESYSKALEYYQKAMDASKDAEFKAKCCFMCAKCEQNYFFDNKPGNYNGDFKAGKYFDLLHSTYASTQYYQEVIKECGYFDTYLKGK